ncbi:L-aspartate oxidase [Klebsormidium nitens]|uniref:L-aspartate oxidase n=1 Tax=Klebsormidium nitens TaxID=105231 RepID=A0A1Y1IHH6_KLENI|nr:L-aspartate oxidase [Klebsormidium nitens]|eukprot:GAQ87588.1 L-aspartate oxidase [Klebsormidium nitens]
MAGQWERPHTRSPRRTSEMDVVLEDTRRQRKQPQEMMFDYVGIVRSTDRLFKALKRAAKCENGVGVAPRRAGLDCGHCERSGQAGEAWPARHYRPPRIRWRKVHAENRSEGRASATGRRARSNNYQLKQRGEKYVLLAFSHKPCVSQHR